MSRAAWIAIAAVGLALAACPSPKKIVCGPANCTGCCDSSGSCQLGDQPATCGIGGALCVTCGATQGCNDGVCGAQHPDGGDGGAMCGLPSGCTGCCDPQGRCLPGTDPTACGNFGGNCAACASPGFCNPIPLDGGGGSCVTPCNAATCEGCCKDPFHCVLRSQENDSQCGTAGDAGESCEACSAGGCDAGACSFGACGTLGCSSGGCCNLMNGFCLAPGQQNDLECGPNGSVCSPCSGFNFSCVQDPNFGGQC